MPKQEHKAEGMSEHNTGCGIQPELLFHPTELYKVVRVSSRGWPLLPYSFLSRYNCRVGMSRCDPAQSRMSRTARFISRRMSTFRYFDECYSAQVKSIESRRAFNEGERERERNCFFEKKTRM